MIARERSNDRHVFVQKALVMCRLIRTNMINRKRQYYIFKIFFLSILCRISFCLPDDQGILYICTRVSNKTNNAKRTLMRVSMGYL